MSQEAKDVIQEEENKDVIQEETTEAETPTLDEDSVAMPPPPEKALEIEKMEEQKLKSKFPGGLMRENIMHKFEFTMGWHQSERMDRGVI